MAPGASCMVPSGGAVRDGEVIFAHCMHFMGIDVDIFHCWCKCFLLTCNEVILAAFQFGALVVDMISMCWWFSCGS